ncbi:Dol-P-Man:Man(5)GlcNAc(2)-PP-Dol alpha-1,3-mannosyltransferase [Talaromyces atroroseus]|uniref:Dol-P-Man:Man(5)GlcNAc(2)-PP-Dol alpha-1,3-mannosyltransferase n=1 Tax=Talaromyces atroroseus TaxID=1441469 RepID=A0A225ALG8_TALAT|nr:Dol-P-Man:Man(5)GlcNAc(2)-PP-Dol alpha-1,3-mannosyltransferase [Talaromyces atroroseus]OKL62421.1 Dol-P-Man:Man(5)GlcNAc(2)-PP-Dol alpha-1,3-mannosyltransferase [Talaromyces atroroseus]
MSKLSPALKALINSPYARPGTIPAPAQISAVYAGIAKEAEPRNVGLRAWFAAATAATMTMNSPESLLQLHQLVSHEKSVDETVYLAELVREIGLKCIGFNGVGEFRAGLPTSIQDALATQPRRNLRPEVVPDILNRGQSLWKSIYYPFEYKLQQKLALSHPDLPVHIIESEYGNLFADPASTQGAPVVSATVGRVLTSIIAVACLRAQTGVGPQVISHVFGLRKAFQDGSATAGKGEEVEGGQWLASDEGSIWLIEIVDRIVESIGRGEGTSFAPGLANKGKL